MVEYSRRLRHRRDFLWLGLLTMALVYADFFVMRYNGLWMENDTSVFTMQATRFLHHASLFFPHLYNHGYAYTAWLGGVAMLSGISPLRLNTLVMPFLGMVLLVMTGYLLFTALLESQLMGVLGGLVLMTIPNIAFAALRGTHEKLSLAFVALGLYFLLKGLTAFTHRQSWWLWLALALLMQFLNVSTNDYFATTFTFALTLTWGFGFMTWKAKPVRTVPELGPALKIVGLVVAASWLIVLWVMFRVYSPEAQDLLLLKGAVNKLLHLFDTLHPGSNPYVAASSTWASQVAYALMSFFIWFVVVMSALMWCVDLYHLLVTRTLLTIPRLFLLGMYAAFAALVVLSIPLDFSGLAAGSNLEVRNFTYVILFGTPLVARALVRSIHGQWRWSPKTPHKRRMAERLLVGLMCLILAIGFLKVTLDPLVSNTWLYYTPGEAEAVQFFWTHNRYQTLWTGPDNRLTNYANAVFWNNPGHNAVLGYTPPDGTEDYLQSRTVVFSCLAQDYPLPPYGQFNRVYDNGGAAIYQKPASTPFMIP
ncbi:MAG: hypothetical protein OWU33_10565 [Firmicutes bacterium]|nr:hypothetical protein [Bacillota bacterium]